MHVVIVCMRLIKKHEFCLIKYNLTAMNKKENIHLIRDHTNK